MIFKKAGFSLALAASFAMAAAAQAQAPGDPEGQMGPPGEHYVDCSNDNARTFLYPDVNMALIRYGCASDVFHAFAGKTVYPEAKKVCDYSGAAMEEAFETECRSLTENEIPADEQKQIEAYLDMARTGRRGELPEDVIAYGKINRYRALSADRGIVLFDESAKTGKAGYLIDFNAGIVKSYFAARDGEAGGFEINIEEAEKMPHTGKIVNNAREFLQSLKPRPAIEP